MQQTDVGQETFLHGLVGNCWIGIVVVIGVVDRPGDHEAAARNPGTTGRVGVSGAFGLCTVLAAEPRIFQHLATGSSPGQALDFVATVGLGLDPADGYGAGVFVAGKAT